MLEIIKQEITVPGFTVRPGRHSSINHQAIVNFPNGWGASIVQGQYTFGGREGLYELAVLDSKGNLHYDNPIADGDVVGYLTEQDVLHILNQIAAFKPEEITQ